MKYMDAFVSIVSFLVVSSSHETFVRQRKSLDLGGRGYRGKKQSHATIEVYLFLAKTVSEGRGSLTQSRRKKKNSRPYFLRNFRCILRLWDFSSSITFCFLLLILIPRLWDFSSGT